MMTAQPLPADVLVTAGELGGIPIEGGRATSTQLCRGLSPWVDLSQSGESMRTKASVDPAVTAAALQRPAEDYLAGAEARTPLASPISADLASLPPLLIQAGSHEVLLDDALRLAARAAARTSESRST